MKRAKRQMARLGGRRLIYEQYGEGQPLLLIHGLSGSARWWQRNIPALAAQFSVYAIDLVGFGGNRAWRPLSLTTAAALLAGFVDDLGTGPAHVVAHSMGGQIALHLAAEHPAQLDRLVLAAASGLVRETVAGMVRRLPRTGRYMAPDFMPTLAWDAFRSGSLNLLRAAHALLHDDISPLLERITAPTLIISGENDALIPPEIGARQHAAIGHSQYVVLPQAGHVLMWDRAQAFNQLVLDFLLA